MSKEVKHGPTDGIAVFAPVIASIIILIGSNGLIRLLSSWLGALGKPGAFSMGILIVYLWFLQGRKPTLRRNSRQFRSVFSQEKQVAYHNCRNSTVWLYFQCTNWGKPPKKYVCKAQTELIRLHSAILSWRINHNGNIFAYIY